MSALIPPQAAADVAVLQEVDALAEPLVSATPVRVLATRPAASETFTLFTNT
jgi:hypothetical protein